MNIIKKTIAIAALSLSSIAAQAEFVSADWQVSNDKQITKDTETNLGWLKLEHSIGMSYTSVTQELGEEGKFSGFRLATLDEFLGLVSNAFPEANLDTDRFGLTTENKVLWQSLLGYSKVESTLQSQGWIMHDSEIRTYGKGHNTFYYAPTDDRTGLFYSAGHTAYSAYLVKDMEQELEDDTDLGNDVPLPSSIALLALGVLGFSRRQRK